MSYWLDTDVLIQAKNKPYKFDRVPQFWSFVDEKLQTGEVRASSMNYKEWTDGTDDLSEWCKRRKANGLAVKPSKDVQDCYQKVCDHVVSKYKPHQAAEFLKGADGWVIAHAMAEGGIVVTEEVRRTTKTSVKVPIVCKALGVRCVDTYQMLDDLDFRIT